MIENTDMAYKYVRSLILYLNYAVRNGFAISSFRCGNVQAKLVNQKMCFSCKLLRYFSTVLTS